jgi:hypothetical protein
MTSCLCRYRIDIDSRSVFLICGFVSCRYRRYRRYRVDIDPWLLSLQLKMLIKNDFWYCSGCALVILIWYELQQYNVKRSFLTLKCMESQLSISLRYRHNIYVYTIIYRKSIVDIDTISSHHCRYRHRMYI